MNPVTSITSLRIESASKTRSYGACCLYSDYILICFDSTLRTIVILYGNKPELEAQISEHA